METTSNARSQQRVGACALGLIALTGFLALGCVRAPDGPLFAWAPEPPPDRGRVYVYRLDPRESLAAVAVRIGGRDLGRLASGEYETLELPSGSHRVRVGMRGLAYTAWGWSDHELLVRPGGTVFLRLAVRLDEGRPSVAGTPSELEIAGRSDSRQPQQNVFISQPSREQASEELATTRRRPDERGY